MSAQIEEIILRQPLFAGVGAEDMALLRPLLRRSTVPAGATILRADDSSDGVYLVVEGTLKVHRVQADGTDVILSILGPGQTAGEMGILGDSPRSADVEALERCVLLWMDAKDFSRCLDTVPRMGANLARIVAGRWRLVSARLESLASLDVPGRVARQILAFVEEYGHEQADGTVIIGIRLTQTDLADIIGASRVRVNQALVEFKRRGYLSVDDDHHIRVLDRDALNRRSR